MRLHFFNSAVKANSKMDYSEGRNVHFTRWFSCNMACIVKVIMAGLLDHFGEYLKWKDKIRIPAGFLAVEHFNLPSTTTTRTRECRWSGKLSVEQHLHRNTTGRK